MTGRAGFAQVLGEAMAARDLPLDRLASRLRAAGAPVSVATLSYWRTGRSIPTRGNSVRAVEALERILQVEPGHLTGALPHDALSRWDPLPVLHSPDMVRRVVEDELGLTLNRRLTALHHHESLTVNPHGVQEESVVSQLVRCDLDEIDSQFVVIQQDAAPKGAPEVEALTGCEVGRVFSFPDTHLNVVEILLPRTFDRGELLALSYRIRWVPTELGQDTSMGRALPSRVDHLILEVRFTGRLPRTVTAAVQPTLDAATVAERELEPAPLVQHIVADAEPGLHSLEWTW